MPSLAELVPEPANLANAFDVVAARTRRRYPTREPDPASLAASQGRAATWEQFLPSEERAFQSAASLQAGGDYNPRDVFLGALGAVGAPASVGGLPAGTLGSGVGKGIRAYHGSPHDFERFDISKIGTGEGAQAYGHGLYFAENEGVARSYRDALKWKGADWNNPEFVANYWLNNQSGGAPGAISHLKASQKYQSTPESKLAVEQAIGILEQGGAGKGSPNPGRMYEVNINAHPEQFLDWDKPLNAHAPPTQDAVKQAMGIDYFGKPDPTKAERLWNEFGGANAGQAVRQGFIASHDKLVADRLREAGVPGIKYLDQGSRLAPANTSLFEAHLADARKAGAGPEELARLEARLAEEQAKNTGTSNYVMFDDKLIDILRKYGLAGLGVGLGVASGQGDANAEPR